MEMVCAPSEIFLIGLVLGMPIILSCCQLHLLYILCWLQATLLFLECHLSRLWDSLFCLHHEVSSRCTNLNWFYISLYLFMSCLSGCVSMSSELTDFLLNVSSRKSNLLDVSVLLFQAQLLLIWYLSPFPTSCQYSLSEQSHIC